MSYRFFNIKPIRRSLVVETLDEQPDDGGFFIFERHEDGVSWSMWIGRYNLVLSPGYVDTRDPDLIN